MFQMQQMQQDMMQMSLSMQAQARMMQARAGEMQESMRQNTDRMRHDFMEMQESMRQEMQERLRRQMSQEEPGQYQWAAHERAVRGIEHTRQHIERTEARIRRHEERMERMARHVDRAHRPRQRHHHHHQQQQQGGLQIMDHGGYPAGSAGGGGPAQPSWGRGHGQGISTVVSNGVLYINSQPVAHVHPNHGVNMQVINGVVYVNGEMVWPQPGGRGQVVPEASAPPPPQEDPFEQAMQYSVRSACEACQKEPCPVCLEPIQVGDEMRTLPCFHLLHNHCAEAHFAQSAARSSRTGGPVLCPVCRHVVGPEMIEIDVDD